jgi:3-hydroxyisobutyrate dehydrogenase
VSDATAAVSGFERKKVGFVGLGVMGAPMAMHVLKERGALHVYNRTESKAAELTTAGSDFASLEDLAKACDVVLICVSRSEDVLECLQRMSGAKPGTLFVDHSTIAPKTAKEIHADLSGKGLRFVDAPVTGGSVGAEKGQLTIFMGGEVADCEEAKAVCAPFTKRSERVGGAGAGQTAKLANQLAVVGTLLSVCESMAFAKKAGLDLAQIREMVGSGAGGSWSYDVLGLKILNEDWAPGFSVVNQLKDLDYCLQTAAEIGAIAPAADLARDLLSRLERAGQGEFSTAALYKEYLEPTD